MFDQIFKLVKEHMGNDSEVASKIPEEKKDAVYNEVATHLTTGLKNQEALHGDFNDMLSMLKGAVASGNPLTSAIVSSLASKFGLPPSVTGAIAGALPGLLQKFAHKAADPNDSSISLDKLANPTSPKVDLGGLFK